MEVLGLSQASSGERVAVKALGSNSFSLGSKLSKFDKRWAICVVGKSESPVQRCKEPFEFGPESGGQRVF